jgi:hypothetical protein
VAKSKVRTSQFRTTPFGRMLRDRIVIGEDKSFEPALALIFSLYIF